MVLELLNDLAARKRSTILASGSIGISVTADLSKKAQSTVAERQCAFIKRHRLAAEAVRDRLPTADATVAFNQSR